MDRYIVGAPVRDIETPALLLDLDAVSENLLRMADFARTQGKQLRPHFKTHKSPFLAHMQLAAGAIGITCQKLSEAGVLALAGIRDILITNEVVGVQKIRRLVNLAAYTNLIIAIDSAENAAEIARAALDKGVVVRCLVEVNCGMNRCGVEPGPPTLALVRQLRQMKGLCFLGIMAYEGHTVFIESLADREAAVSRALALVSETRQLLASDGIDCPIVSCAGTGSYMISGRHPDVTELEVGSYLTMDAKYSGIEGVGSVFRNALSLLTTVISRPADNRIVLDAGMKSISREFGMPLLKNGPEGAELYKLSEEHGLVSLSKGSAALFKIGQKIELIPSHGCTTINLHDVYYGIRSGIVECVLPIEARGKAY